MNLNFSIVIPVYNRPQEIDELLESLCKQDFSDAFEVLVIEDGSSEKCDEIVAKYKSKLNVTYLFKENSGAGASRNFGMDHANGNYFIILDSDVLVPNQYLSSVKRTLEQSYTDAFGGPDAAHSSFTVLQKAINYSMTSVLTTGGIRGKKNVANNFQPRSFNMGLSKSVFEATGGFGKHKVGEDIDLSLRIREMGFTSQLISEAFVYHKRRTSLSQFYKQTFAFGTARPLLNKRYPETAKITYWFPLVFIIGLDFSLIALFFGYWQGLELYTLYFGLLFLDSLFQSKNIAVAFLSIITSLTQFFGYGLGFLEAKFTNKDY